MSDTTVPTPAPEAGAVASSVGIKDLLEAGVHFGHQTRRWNPKMKQYIFGERNGIYIIDLQKTHKLLQEALQFVQELASQGKNVMFIGTKRQAQEAIAEEAKRCGMPFVTERWLGGLLTNFVTVRRSLERLRDLEMTLTGPQEAQRERLTKKELAGLDKEREKLEKNLTGIKGMKSVPDAVFVIDTRLEAIAVAEARKLKIPVIGVLDTNCDPDEVDVPDPGQRRRAAGHPAVRRQGGRRRARRPRPARGAAGGDGGRRRARARTARRAPGSHPDRLTSPGPRGPGRRPTPRASPIGPRGFPRTDIPKEEELMSISAEVVRQLREETGAGMMDCKSALVEAQGDMEKARDLLRKKGLAAASKRASRTASEGQIGAYIHPGAKVGVLVEVNCETDFVAKTPEFQALVKDVAMHIAAASPAAAQYVSKDEVPAEILEKEKEIYRAQAVAQGKPANVVDRIAEGKVKEYYSTFCLLEQTFVKDPKLTVGQLVQEKIAVIKENIVIRRFSRYRLGEESGTKAATE